jgi:hypothetical protein
MHGLFRRRYFSSTEVHRLSEALLCRRTGGSQSTLPSSSTPPASCSVGTYLPGYPSVLHHGSSPSLWWATSLTVRDGYTVFHLFLCTGSCLFRLDRQSRHMKEWYRYSVHLDPGAKTPSSQILLLSKYLNSKHRAHSKVSPLNVKQSETPDTEILSRY